MPRFAANLSMMFTEVPFIERFAAARKAGFDAVEFLFPYDYSTLQIQKQLEQNHLHWRCSIPLPEILMRGNGDYPPFPDVSTKHTQTSTWHWNMHWRSIVNKSM